MKIKNPNVIVFDIPYFRSDKNVIGSGIRKGTYSFEDGHYFWSELDSLCQFYKNHNYAGSYPSLAIELSVPIKFGSKISVYPEVDGKIESEILGKASVNPKIFDATQLNNSISIAKNSDFIFNGIVVRSNDGITVELSADDVVLFDGNTGLPVAINTKDNFLRVQGVAPYSVEGLKKVIQNSTGQTQVDGGVNVYKTDFSEAQANQVSENNSKQNDGWVTAGNIDITLKSGKPLVVTSLNEDGTRGKSTLVTANKDIKAHLPQNSTAHYTPEEVLDEVNIPSGSQMKFDGKAYTFEELESESDKILVLPEIIGQNISARSMYNTAFNRNLITFRNSEGTDCIEMTRVHNK